MAGPRKINKGQRLTGIPADGWNAFVDTTHRVGQSRGIPMGAGTSSASDERNVVFVKNSTGKDLIERSIVGIKKTVKEFPDIVEPDEDSRGNVADASILETEAVEVEKPDPIKHTAGRWGVTLGPIKNGDAGWMAIGGLIKCRIDVTDASHKFAKLAKDETEHLVSASAGIAVTFRKLQDETGEEGQGKQWGQINLSGGAGTGLPQFGLLIGDVPEATAHYDATRSYIEHGYAESVVIPLELVKDAEVNGDQIKAELNGEGEQKILDCINPIWSTEIKAGSTTNADKPVIVRGYQDDWNILEGEEVEEKRVFVLSQIYYPITIMSGLTSMAVTGSAFSVDSLTLLWGRDPGVEEILDVANPDAWEAEEDVYCLIMQLTDGTWQAIDLRCPEEE